jgi:hypothetical protein
MVQHHPMHGEQHVLCNVGHLEVGIVMQRNETIYSRARMLSLSDGTFGALYVDGDVRFLEC